MIQDHNDKLNKLFDKNEPFSLVRIGAMEGIFLQSYFNKYALPESCYHALFFAAGVYPVDDNYLMNVWMKNTLNAMNASDMVGFVDIPETIKNDKLFLEEHCKNKPLFFKDDIGVLNPTTILSLGNPWTQKLKGKKVLVVSSHKETIEHQWKNIESVWGKNVNKITPFELVGVVRSPFNPLIDNRQYDNCKTWDDTLSIMCDKISEFDYDVLLVGAGAFSPGLAAFAKMCRKIGITLCGDIQLLFGILGARWESYSKDEDKHNWIYTLESDLPQKKQNFDQIERAYWK